MSPTFKFCTDSFSKESCERIVAWFKRKYGIATRLVPSNNQKGWRVQVMPESNDAFVELIRPYVLPMFSYKIDRRSNFERRTDNPAKLAFADVSNCPIGKSFVALSHDKRDKWTSKLVTYLRHQGFDALLQQDGVHEGLRKILSFDSKRLMHDDCVGYSAIGSRALMAFFPNFWHAKGKAGLSPVDVFEDDDCLAEVVTSILTEGYFPRRWKVLSKIRGYRGSRQVSTFPPCVAKAIYDKHCPEGTKVLDFCAGWGGRLAGAIASENVASYTGVEVDFHTHIGLNNLQREMCIHSPKPVTLINADAVDGMGQFRDGAFDFCFTSPPYFDVEQYSDGSDQSTRRFPTYGAWMEGFLFSAISEAMRVSRKVAINVANTGAWPIADDLERWLQRRGAAFSADRKRSPAFGGGYRTEPIFLIG